MSTKKQRFSHTYRIAAGFLTVLFFVFLFFALSLPAHAADTGKQPASADDIPSFPVFLDGKATGFRAPVFREGTTFLPLSLLARMLLAENTFSFDRNTGKASVTGDALSVHAAAGEIHIEANGRYFALSAQKPAENLLYNGQLYVPVRTGARAFGGDVFWDAERKAVCLSRGTGTVVSGEAFYDADTLYCLSHILSSEAGDQPLCGQLAVGAVIMNRVKSPEFPDTVRGVVFDRRGAVQFTPTANGTYWKEPQSLSVTAAKLILDGCLVSDEALYFLDPRIATNFWIPQNRTYLFSAGDHDFYS